MIMSVSTCSLQVTAALGRGGKPGVSARRAATECTAVHTVVETSSSSAVTYRSQAAQRAQGLQGPIASSSAGRAPGAGDSGRPGGTVGALSVAADVAAVSWASASVGLGTGGAAGAGSWGLAKSAKQAGGALAAVAGEGVGADAAVAGEASFVLELLASSCGDGEAAGLVSAVSAAGSPAFASASARSGPAGLRVSSFGNTACCAFAFCAVLCGSGCGSGSRPCLS
mgnify:CR=1 FL=1